MSVLISVTLQKQDIMSFTFNLLTTGLHVALYILKKIENHGQGQNIQP